MEPRVSLSQFFSLARRFGRPALRLWPWLLTGVAVGLLAALWWFGPAWEVAGTRPLQGWLARALVTVGLLLVAMFLWGIRLMAHLRRARAQQQSQQQQQEDPLLAVESQQHQIMDHWLAQLDGLSSAAAGRHRLPWYLLLGDEASGKTSLVQRLDSAQRLAIGEQASPEHLARTLPAMGWLGQHALLLDAPGELLRQDQGERQTRLWQNLLEWLVKARPQQPLNGVILTVDLAFLCRADQNERDAQAKRLRARVRELTARCGDPLPVYVVLTKLDLLQGAVPFLEALDFRVAGGDRTAPLGLSFAINHSAGDDWLNQLESGLASLAAQCSGRLAGVLTQCRGLEERAACFSFVRQMSGLQPIVKQFLRRALATDTHSAATLVRGCWFASAFQEGVPEDGYLTACARHYGLGDPIQSAHRGDLGVARAGVGQGWFTDALMERMIAPEAGLAGGNRTLARRQWRNFGLAASVALAVGFTVTGGLNHFFVQNAQAAQQTSSTLASFLRNFRPEQSLSAGSEGTEQLLIKPLNELKTAADAFDDPDQAWPVIEDMGFYRGDEIAPAVHDAYREMLAYQFVPSVMVGVNERMNLAPEGSAERLRHLRILRMLYDASGRQPDRVADYLRNHWQQRYPGDRPTQEQLMAHLEEAMVHTDLADWADAGDSRAFAAIEPFADTVRRAQQRLSASATAQRVYDEIRAQVAGQQPDLDLTAVAGPVFTSVFIRFGEAPQSSASSGPNADPSAHSSSTGDPYRIPGWLTQQGLRHHFADKASEVSETALVDAWVLGRRDGVDYSEADHQRLQQEVYRLYAADYVAAWQKALDHLSFPSLRDVNHGAQVLTDLTGVHQPLQSVLATVAEQTSMNVPPTRSAPPAAGDSAGSIAAATELTAAVAGANPQQRELQARLWADISEPFRELQRVATAMQDRSSEDPLNAVLASLRDYMTAVAESQDTGAASLAAARKRISLQGEDPIYSLQRLAERQPQPLRGMLAQLAKDCWKVVLNQAIAQLEKQWYRDVYQPFQVSLARNYPFDREAGRDAALRDFEAFFAPGGTLDRFYNESLKVFLEDQPEHIAMTRRARMIRKDVRQALAGARQIQEAFFTRSGSLDLEFSLEPLALSSNQRRSIANFDGQLVEFSHGLRQSIPLVWPNTLRDSVESRVTLVPVEVNHSPRSVSAQGAWSLFRLLDQAELTGVSANTVDVRFSLNEGSVRYRLYAGKSVNPFTRTLVNGYSVPARLY